MDDVTDSARSTRFMADAEMKVKEDRAAFAVEQEVAAAEDDCSKSIGPLTMGLTRRRRRRSRGL
jgi:hypothetical protein